MKKLIFIVLIVCVGQINAQVCFKTRLFTISPICCVPYITTADFNNDGKWDIATSNSSSDSLYILLGNGIGNFAISNRFKTPYRGNIISGDFNNDGNIDIVQCNSNYGAYSLSIYLGDGTGNFSTLSPFGPIGLASEIIVNDFNNDGNLDLITNLVTNNNGGNQISVMYGDGTGNFNPHIDYTVANNGVGELATGDFNNDANPDLAMGINIGNLGPGGGIAIMLGDSLGNFGTPTNFTLGTIDPPDPFSLCVADFNTDGFLDIGTANGTRNSVSVLLGNGTGNFDSATTFPVGLECISILSMDFDLDGKLDLAVGNQYSNSVSVLLGTGTGSFGAPQSYVDNNVPQKIVSGDFNSDGKPDIAVGNQQGNKISVLLSPTNISKTLTLALCEGESVTVGANAYDSAGTYVDSLVQVCSGYDSIVTTHLTFLPNNTGSQTLVLCEGQSITIGLNTHDTTGVYIDTIPSANGCDSILTTDLTIKPNSISSQTFILCAGGSVAVGLNTYDTTGIYTDIFPSANGCDSIINTYLTVLPINTITQYSTICSGDSVTVGMNTYYISATYIDTLTSLVNGCDSIVTTNLTVLPINTITQSPIICAGDSLSVGIKTYTSNGSYIDTVLSYQGCDSVITTNLTILPANTFSQSFTLCPGQSVTVGSNTYAIDGTYTDTLTSLVNGCDSTVTTTITTVVLTSSVSFSNGILTANDSTASYQWIDCNNGLSAIAGDTNQTFTASMTGDYAVIVTENGCSDTSSCYQVLCDVWPGDANNDSIVDNDDLLTLGLYYGLTGTARDTISNLWQGYFSMNWDTLQTNGFDMKHVDCNGDSIVDANDTLAVNLNFNLTHAIAPSNNQYKQLGDSLYIITSNTSYNAGDWVDAEVWLGTAASPVSNLYGIAFNIDYNASIVQPGTESITYPNSWLGNPGTDAIKIFKADPLANIAYGAIVKTNHSNSTGYGKIADFKFQIKNTVPTADTIALSISHYNAVDAVGVPQTFNNAASTTLNVAAGTVGIEEQESLNGISIYPNPYSGSTQISYTLNKKSDVNVEVYNTIGQKVETLVNTNQTAGEYKYTFSAKEKGFDAGVYFVKITVDGKSTMKRIVEMR